MKVSQLCRGLRDPNFSDVLAPIAAELIEQIVATLEFYADPHHYRTTLRNPTDNVFADRGKRAFDLLQSVALKDANLQFQVNGYRDG